MMAGMVRNYGLRMPVLLGWMLAALSFASAGHAARAEPVALWCEPSAYGAHSMRRTKVAQIYKKTGNLRAVQLLLGHTKMDSTVRYLGVDPGDALSLSEGIDL